MKGGDGLRRLRDKEVLSDRSSTSKTKPHLLFTIDFINIIRIFGNAGVEII